MIPNNFNHFRSNLESPSRLMAANIHDSSSIFKRIESNTSSAAVHKVTEKHAAETIVEEIKREFKLRLEEVGERLVSLKKKLNPELYCGIVTEYTVAALKDLIYDITS